MVKRMTVNHAMAVQFRSFTFADMVEMADTIVLETIAAMRTGSMPVIGTLYSFNGLGHLATNQKMSVRIVHREQKGQQPITDYCPLANTEKMDKNRV